MLLNLPGSFSKWDVSKIRSSLSLRNELIKGIRYPHEAPYFNGNTDASWNECRHATLWVVVRLPLSHINFDWTWKSWWWMSECDLSNFNSFATQRITITASAPPPQLYTTDIIVCAADSVCLYVARRCDALKRSDVMWFHTIWTFHICIFQ